MTPRADMIGEPDMIGELDIERLHAGDALLFARLVHVYTPRLLPYLRRFATDEDALDDLAQELWLRAFDKRRGYNGRGSFLGWLFTVARTVGLAAVARAGRESRADPLPEIAVTSDADSPIVRERVREAVLALPERQRDVVLLRLIEGYSTAETARRLGCAQGTVKATLHHATRSLRDLLSEWSDKTNV